MAPLDLDSTENVNVASNVENAAVMRNLTTTARAWFGCQWPTAAAAVAAPSSAAATSNEIANPRTAFFPGAPWPDTSGAIIDAHGAGLLTVGSSTYWYGSQRHGHPMVNDSQWPKNTAFCYPPPSISPAGLVKDGFTEGINMYAAANGTDLYNWQHVGLVFAANKTGAHCLERPKVVKCPGTGKFVLWAKGYDRPSTHQGERTLAVIATAESPFGPFDLVNTSQPFFN